MMREVKMGWEGIPRGKVVSRFGVVFFGMGYDNPLLPCLAAVSFNVHSL